MGSRLATIVVESRLLVREALKSLMTKHSYRVVCDVGSTAGISAATISNPPRLAILGAQSADRAVTEAGAIRKLWPDSKVILLYENASLADFQKLLASEIDGYVPLFASPDTLIATLDMIVIQNVRIMVPPDSNSPAIQPAQLEASHQSEIKLQSEGAEHEDVSVRIGAANAQPSVTLRNRSELSGREVQILYGLVKGHTNKVIAHTCDITEATVKAHMKSLLRKIRVGNRTQAAMWAIKNGYAADGTRGRVLDRDPARNAASITESAIRSVATIVGRSRIAEDELPSLAHAG